MLSEGSNVLVATEAKWSVAPAERNGGGLSTYNVPGTTEGKGGLPLERVPQRGIMRKKRGNLTSTIIRTVEAISNVGLGI